MNFIELISLDGKKILTIFIFVVLASVPGFIPAITNPMLCVRTSCEVNIGMPASYMTMNMGGGKPTDINFNFVNLAIDIAVFYLITAILFYLFRGGGKNVPNSDS